MRSKAFEIGFLCGLLPFIVANFYSYRPLSRVIGGGNCNDCGGTFGWPFEMFSFNGFIGQWSVLAGGLTANLSLALAVGLVAGWACGRVFKPTRLP
jgi:hypothetical protein